MNPSKLAIICILAAVAATIATGCSGTRHLASARIDMPTTLAPGYADSLCEADRPWWEFYTDSTLCDLIDRALHNNRDLLVAAARVDEARQLLGLANAERLPQLGALATPSRETEHYSTDIAKRKDLFELKATASWELNLWGAQTQNVRRADATLRATEEQRRGVQMALVAEVASLYYTLRALESELNVVRRTLLLRQDNAHYIKLRFDYGVESELVYRQALVELATTAALVPGLENRVTQTNNAIAVLLGELPGNIYVRKELDPDEALSASGVQIGIPSELLQRRPDLRASEQTLKAAMAAVGVAYANRFPSLTIGLTGGLENNALEGFFKSPYSYTVASIAGPLFDFGRRKRKYRAAIAAYEQARLQYEGDVIAAFSDVADAVSHYRHVCQTVEKRTELRDAAKRYSDLASANVRAGNTGHIDEIDAQRRYFEAQTSLVNAVRDRYLSLIYLYKALGGGWQDAPAR